MISKGVTFIRKEIKLSALCLSDRCDILFHLFALHFGFLPPVTAAWSHVNKGQDFKRLEAMKNLIVPGRLRRPILVGEYQGKFYPIGGSKRIALALYFRLETISVAICPLFPQCCRHEKQYSLRTAPFSELSSEVMSKFDAWCEVQDYLKEGCAMMPETKLEALLQRIQALQEVRSKYECYQGFARIGLVGQRPVEERFQIYGLDKMLTSQSDVLDIGCNIGCLSLLVAEKARMVYGFDHNPKFIEIAKDIQRYLGIQNCSFSTSDMVRIQTPIQFDLVLSLAVHRNDPAHFRIYAEVLRDKCKPGGLLVFESRNFEGTLDFCKSCVEHLRSIGFTEQWSGRCQEQSGTKQENLDRMFWVLRRD